MKLCNLEMSKTLQELGYDGEYYCYIDKDTGCIVSRDSDLYSWHIRCPRVDDAVYWLLNKYNMKFGVQSVPKGYIVTLFYGNNHSFVKTFNAASIEDIFSSMLDNIIAVIKNTL